jgi:hypothetical protein
LSTCLLSHCAILPNFDGNEIKHSLTVAPQSSLPVTAPNGRRGVQSITKIETQLTTVVYGIDTPPQSELYLTWRIIQHLIQGNQQRFPQFQYPATATRGLSLPFVAAVVPGQGRFVAHGLRPPAPPCERADQRVEQGNRILIVALYMLQPEHAILL